MEVLFLIPFCIVAAILLALPIIIGVYVYRDAERRGMNALLCARHDAAHGGIGRSRDGSGNGGQRSCFGIGKRRNKRIGLRVQRLTEQKKAYKKRSGLTPFCAYQEGSLRASRRL